MKSEFALQDPSPSHWQPSHSSNVLDDDHEIVIGRVRVGEYDLTGIPDTVNFSRVNLITWANRIFQKPRDLLGIKLSIRSIGGGSFNPAIRVPKTALDHNPDCSPNAVSMHWIQRG